MTETTLTCATCKYMGGVSWDNGCTQQHYCAKEAERRRDTIRPSGDFAEDFMRNFIAFFDARYDHKACRHYEEAGPLSDSDLRMLRRFDESGQAKFGYFSSENSEASKHPSVLYEGDQYRNEPGRQSYKLTRFGKYVRKQLAAALSEAEPAS